MFPPTFSQPHMCPAMQEATLGAQAQATLKTAKIIKETVKPYEQGESRTEESSSAKDSDKWRYVPPLS